MTLARHDSPHRLIRGHWWTALLTLFPLLLIASLIGTLTLSRVAPNLWIVDGHLAELVIVAYIVLLIAAVVLPHPILHRVGAPLGVLTFAGRAGGFLEIVLDDRPDLIAAVLERASLATACVVWHVIMAFRTAPLTVH